MQNEVVVNTSFLSELSDEQIAFVKRQSADLIIEMTAHKALQRVITSNALPRIDSLSRFFCQCIGESVNKAFAFYGVDVSTELRDFFGGWIADFEVHWNRCNGDKVVCKGMIDENCKLFKITDIPSEQAKASPTSFLMKWNFLQSLREELAENIKISQINPTALEIMLGINQKYPEAYIMPTLFIPKNIRQFLLLERNLKEEEIIKFIKNFFVADLLTCFFKKPA